MRGYTARALLIIAGCGMPVKVGISQYGVQRHAAAVRAGQKTKKAQYMDGWVESFVGHLRTVRGASAHTVKAYAEDLLQWADFCRRAGVTDAGRVETALVRAYLSHLTTERGLAQATVARKMASVRAFYRFLVRRGVVTRSPRAGGCRTAQGRDVT